MNTRINIWHIIKAHFDTFKHIKTKKSRLLDYVIIIAGTPLLFASLFFYFDLSITNVIGDLIKAIAIFGAFLFNLLALIYNLSDKIKEDRFKLKYAKEIHINISYAILLSLIMIVFFILYEVLVHKEINCALVYKVYMSILIFLLTHYLLTLVMILNKVFIIMKSEDIKEKP